MTTNQGGGRGYIMRKTLNFITSKLLRVIDPHLMFDFGSLEFVWSS